MIENKEVVPAENPNSADSAPKPAEVGLTGMPQLRLIVKYNLFSGAPADLA
jgi:hypothetical protein